MTSSAVAPLFKTPRTLMSDLDHAVDTVIADCLGVTAGEDVLVVVDAETRELGDALRGRAAAGGADAVLVLMDERADHRTEAPPPGAPAPAAPAVLVPPAAQSLS